MKESLKGSLRDTKKVLSTRWSASDLHVPAWVINSIIYITIIRSLVYGLELFILGNAAAVTPFAAFATILGIATWGSLMTAAIIVLLIGLMLKNSIIVTFGSLFCAAVWIGFSSVLCLGWIDLGTGGRYAIASMSTAVTWAIFFFIQLRTLSKNGVET